MTYNKKLNLVQTCAETKYFLGMIFWKAGRTTIKNSLAILLCVAYFFHHPLPLPLPLLTPGMYLYLYLFCL